MNPDTSDLIGCIILSGAQDWQIFQRDSTGFAAVKLSGEWRLPPIEQLNPLDRQKPVVVVRVVNEYNSSPVTTSLDWQHATTRADGTWEIELRIPTGGLYRVETAIESGRIEWATHGDNIHHLGVGDLWVIAGQSNSSGYGRGYAEDPVELGVHMLGNDEEWRLATHPLNSTRRNRHANLDGSNGRHSPYLAFARQLKRELGIPVGLIPTALGGSSLDKWNPVENPDAALYKNMIHCIRLAGGKVSGVLWYQGEGDASIEKGGTYERRFIEFVNSFRKDLALPGLPIITAQLNKCFGPSSETETKGWSLMRDVQRRIPHALKNCAVVPTTDLTVGDIIHNSAASNMTLAIRFASAALGMVYGKDKRFRFAEIESAKSEGASQSVILTFANVVQRLHTDVIKVREFTVEDKDGEVPVESTEFVSRNQIRLKLGRTLAANPVVHGQYSRTPSIDIYEIEANSPLLGFHAFPIS